MRIKTSRLLGLAMAAAVGLAALTGAPEQAQAHKRGFSLYLGHGGFGLSVGPRYGYGYYPYYGHYYPAILLPAALLLRAAQTLLPQTALWPLQQLGQPLRPQLGLAQPQLARLHAVSRLPLGARDGSRR